MRNVTKIYITRIQGLQGEWLYRNGNEYIQRPSCSKIIDEGKDTWKKGLKEESESDESDSEKDISYLLKKQCRKS